jgi:hypothetical protein
MRYAVSIAVVLALLAAFAGLGFLLVLVIGVSAFVGGAVAVAEHDVGLRPLRRHDVT